jgi:hypothetical protein
VVRPERDEALDQRPATCDALGKGRAALGDGDADQAAPRFLPLVASGLCQQAKRPHGFRDRFSVRTAGRRQDRRRSLELRAKPSASIPYRLPVTYPGAKPEPVQARNVAFILGLDSFLDYRRRRVGSIARHKLFTFGRNV